MKTEIAAILLLAGLAMPSTADEVVISSLDSNGTIVFDEITNARSYRVEWTSKLTPGAWTNTWASLNHIPSTGSGAITASVPMFFRVVATTLPDLLISEIMYDPFAVPDSAGEWFEIYNRGLNDVDLNGLTIGSGTSESHVISNGIPLVIGAGSYLVLGLNSDAASNGFTPVSYEYTGVLLANTADSISLRSGTNLIDEVRYDESAGYPIASGASLYLKPSAWDDLSNDSATNWALSTLPYGSGDKGTPGQANVN